MSPLCKIVTGICLIAAAPLVVIVTIPFFAAISGVAVSIGVSAATAVSVKVIAATVAGDAAVAIGAAVMAEGVYERYNIK